MEAVTSKTFNNPRKYNAGFREVNYILASIQLVLTYYDLSICLRGDIDLSNHVVGQLSTYLSNDILGRISNYSKFA